MLAVERKRIMITFMGPGTVILVAIAVGLFLFAFGCSLFEWNLLKPQLRRFIGLGNYAYAVKDPRFWHSLTVSLKFSGITTGFCMVFGMWVAMLLNRNPRFKNLFVTIFLIPMILAPVLVAMVWRMLFDPYWGYVNYFLHLFGFRPDEPIAWCANPKTALWSLIIADVWQWTSFNIIVILAGLQSLPTEPYEAALVDGANRFQSFRHITIPLLRPTLIVALIFRLMNSFKIFPTIFMMTYGGPGITTEALNYYAFRTTFDYYNIGYGTALAVIMFFISFMLAIIIIRGMKFEVGW
jgi:multiple sugar transport system permease protein